MPPARRTRRTVRWAAATALILVITATGCGDTADAEAEADTFPEAQPAQTSFEIAIDDAFQYEPQTLTVPAGQVVEVVNRASNAHSVTSFGSAPSSFDTGLLAEGDTAQFRLTAPGRYPYHCMYHEELEQGLIVVQ